MEGLPILSLMLLVPLVGAVLSTREEAMTVGSQAEA